MTLLRPSQLQQAGAAIGDMLAWDGTEWEPASVGGGGPPSFTGARAYRVAALNISHNFFTNGDGLYDQAGWAITEQES